MLQLLSTKVGPRTQAEQRLMDDVEGGNRISPRRVKSIYGLYEKDIPHPDLKGQINSIKEAKKIYMDRALLHAKEQGLIGDVMGKDFMDRFFDDPKAYMGDKPEEKTSNEDFAKAVDEYMKQHMVDAPDDGQGSFSGQLGEVEKRHRELMNKNKTTRHSGGPVFRDGLHNLQKGEFVVPKHFKDGGIVSGGLETTGASNGTVVVGKMEDAFDDFLIRFETILDDSKLEAPEFPDLIIGNLDEVNDSLELTVPDIPDIKIEDIDKLTSISIEGLEALGNIPDRINVEVAGSVDTSTGDANMTDTITTAINDALREANVGADGRDDLADVFRDIRDQILSVNGRVTESTDSIEILNRDINDLGDDYKSYKSEMITTGNELRTMATDLNNGVKGTVRTNQESISDLNRELLMIKTRMASSDSGRVIG